MDSFKEKRVIEVFCKTCGKRYNDNYEFERVFGSKTEARKEITKEGWTVKKNDAYCEECNPMNNPSNKGNF